MSEQKGGYLAFFWKAAVSLAGIAGLYLGAVAVNRTAAFWFIMGLAALLTLCRKGLRVVATARRKLQDATRRADTLEVENKKLRRHVDASARALEARRMEGIHEGRKQLMGLALSQSVDPPILSGVHAHEHGAALVATYSGQAPRLGARFTVAAMNTGTPYASVEVAEVNSTKGYVLLIRAGTEGKSFWGRLEGRVESDPAAPPGVELIPYQLPEVQPSQVPALDEQGKSDG